MFVVLSTGCTKNWLDINQDPNNAADATSELVFPAGTLSIGACIGGQYNLIGGFWSQYWSQSNASNQYKFIDQYLISEGDFNVIWREMYANGLADINIARNKARESKNNAFYLMSTVMQAYGFTILVDFYNNVPYSEAFQGNADVKNYNPKYEDGKSIYLDLISKIDTALALEMNELTDKQKSQDLVFKGDINSWIRFANTLKLKMFLRMAYSDPAYAQQKIQELYANGAEFLNQDAGLNIFIDEAKKDNPLFESDRRSLNTTVNLRVSATLFFYLRNNADPRIDYVVQGNITSATIPMPQGGFGLPDAQLNHNNVAVFDLYPTTPVYFISAIESRLLQAEAIERGWGTGDAKSLYDAAITLDFTRKGFDGSSFVATGGVYEYPSTGSFEQKLESIIMAKWVAFAGTQGAEAFFEWCRTGYPRVSSIPAWQGNSFNNAYLGGQFTYSLGGTTTGKFPQRLIYPQDEVNLNKNFPGQVSVTDKVWWNKK